MDTNNPKKAGRPKGSPNKKTQEIAAKAIESGISPLEVMLEAMRWARDNGDLTAAAGFAKDAAPYIHPRLAAVSHTGANGGAIQLNVTQSDLGVL